MNDTLFILIEKRKKWDYLALNRFNQLEVMAANTHSIILKKVGFSLIKIKQSTTEKKQSIIFFLMKKRTKCDQPQFDRMYHSKAIRVGRKYPEFRKSGSSVTAMKQSKIIGNEWHAFHPYWKTKKMRLLRPQSVQPIRSYGCEHTFDYSEKSWF